jgi:hypothetical protein
MILAYTGLKTQNVFTHGDDSINTTKQMIDVKTLGSVTLDETAGYNPRFQLVNKFFKSIPYTEDLKKFISI